MTTGKNKGAAPKNHERERGSTEERVSRNLSEYGKQLKEKQKAKRIYGTRERAFRRLFKNALKQKGSPGQALLVSLERRLDNVVFRLKMAKTRKQARQMIVHGHILVNGKKVTAPSLQVALGDQISLHESTLAMNEFMEQVVDKMMKMSTKMPDWIELDKANKVGRILRLPVRDDIAATPSIAEHLIVELYSK